MPLKRYDPFNDSTKNLSFGVNPFLNRFAEIAGKDATNLLHAEKLRNAKGNWRNLFPNGFVPKELVVEIGCHMGHTLLEMARRRPDVGFIGFDITLKRVVSTSERFRKSGLNNLICVYANASSIDLLFDKSELNGVVVFFPDPWPKKKQLKNRLFQPNFCQSLVSILRSDGFLWFKTDHEGYFAEASSRISAAGMKNFNGTFEYFGPTDIPSVFQNMFTKQNVPYFEQVWLRKPDFLQ